MSKITEQEIKKELENELRKIYDDNDFVLCTFNSLNNSTARKMLGFIYKAGELKDNVTYEDIVGLSLVLKREK